MTFRHHALTYTKGCSSQGTRETGGTTDKVIYTLFQMCLKKCVRSMYLLCYLLLVEDILPPTFCNLLVVCKV